MDSTTLFPSFPDTARLWIYAADATLTSDDEAALRRRMNHFIEEWSSHDRPVRGAFQIKEHRFLLLAATLKSGAVSGCGIDASVHAIDEAAAARDISWIPTLHVIYRDAEGQIQHCSRSTFRSLAARGRATTETPVFDMGLDTVEALRAGQFEQPAGTSWHAEAFDLPQPA